MTMWIWLIIPVQIYVLLLKSQDVRSRSHIVISSFCSLWADDSFASSFRTCWQLHNLHYRGVSNLRNPFLNRYAGKLRNRYSFRIWHVLVWGLAIFVVANQHLKGLKKCSGMLGSISDLNVGSLQWSRWHKYCSSAPHYTNLKISHTNRFCIMTPIVGSKYQ
jgi:hypothetical protein